MRAQTHAAWSSLPPPPYLYHAQTCTGPLPPVSASSLFSITPYLFHSPIALPPLRTPGAGHGPRVAAAGRLPGRRQGGAGPPAAAAALLSGRQGEVRQVIMRGCLVTHARLLKGLRAERPSPHSSMFRQRFRRAARLRLPVTHGSRPRSWATRTGAPCSRYAYRHWTAPTCSTPSLVSANAAAAVGVSYRSRHAHVGNWSRQTPPHSEVRCHFCQQLQPLQKAQVPVRRLCAVDLGALRERCVNGSIQDNPRLAHCVSISSRQVVSIPGCGGDPFKFMATVAAHVIVYGDGKVARGFR